MKRYSWIIFDLDGTLLNTIEDITDALNYALNQLKVEVQITNENTKNFIGSGAKKLIERTLKFCGVDKTKEEEFSKIYFNYYSNHMSLKTNPYPYVKELLEKLKKENVKLGVLSNKPHRDVISCIEKYFPDTFNYVSGQKENVRPKPHQEIFETFKKLNNVSNEDVLYVGDMEIDALFAKNIGVDLCLVTFGFGKNLHLLNPKYLIDNYRELIEGE